MTQQEKSLVDRLLRQDFPGRDAIREQLQNCEVEPLDSDGSLRVYPEANSSIATKHRVPIEMEAKDSDGVAIHILLHVVNGLVEELEVFKDNGAPILTMPRAENFELFCPDNWEIR